MGSKNEGEKAFQMAQNARRYRYQLVWYRYHYGTVAFIIMGTGTNMVLHQFSSLGTGTI